MRASSDRAKTPPRATLELVGIPGETVTIFRETPLDAPPPPIFEGEFPTTGRLRLRVPRSSLLVVASGFGKAAVQFDQGENFQRVDVRPAGSHS
jgi:hypothetical protein